MMENISIAQKESAIAMRIKQLRKNQELGPLLSAGSCLNGTCGTQRTEDLAKSSFNHIVGYFSEIEDLVIEKLRKETLSELGELLCLYLEKQEIYQNRGVAT